jgi:hypothetical protein
VIDVVVAAGDAGLRAGALLAERGPVRVFCSEAVSDGPPTGELISAGDAGELARAVGDVVPVDVTRGVAFGDRVLSLPVFPTDLARLVGADLGRVVRGVARARFDQRLGNVFGLGNEERDYASWLRRRLGDRLVTKLYLDYASRRYAAPPASLAAWLGWWTHARTPAKRMFAPAAGQAGARRFQRERVLASGGEVVDGVEFQAIEVEDRRVVAVVGDTGREHVGGRLYLERRPLEVMAMLPEASVDEPWRYDVSRLPGAHAVEVTFATGPCSLPFEVHLLDGGPAWRVIRPGALPGEAGGTVRVDLSLADGDPLWGRDDAAIVAAAARSVSALVAVSGGVVRRRPWAVPTLGLVSALSLGRRLDAYDALGIVGVGARGAHRPFGLGDEVALVSDVIARPPTEKKLASQRETHRQRLERPVRLPPKASPWVLISD